LGGATTKLSEKTIISNYFLIKNPPKHKVKEGFMVI